MKLPAFKLSASMHVDARFVLGDSGAVKKSVSCETRARRMPFHCIRPAQKVFANLKRFDKRTVALGPISQLASSAMPPTNGSSIRCPLLEAPPAIDSEAMDLPRRLLTINLCDVAAAAAVGGKESRGEPES